MHKPTDGARRPAARLRPTRTRSAMAVRVNGRGIRVARAVRALLHGGSRTAAPLGASLAGTLRSLTTAERALPLAVAAIVAVASLLAVLPNTPQGAVGGTQGSGTPVRIAIGGGTDPAEADVQGDGGAALVGDDPSFRPVTIPENVTTEPGSVTEQADAAAMLDDGTLLTGYAPSTTVEDGADLIQTYKVRSGDTLVTIAHHFGVSMMTLWWANKLPSKDALHIGQVLRIPPVNGLVVTVKATDTLDSLAAEYKVDADRIVELNGLEDPTLVVGQVLVLPGARGEPIPTPKPTPKPVVKTHVSSGSSGGVHYTGGRMRWPVIGGNNYISQYYHYGHWALDIAAQYGSKVVAAAAGRVTFAGWKSNGGGYQVWISHGGGIYTTYNHMSAITVGIGQSVGRGQQVGRIGQSGDATGPHLHFEVWRGPIWNGGTRVNPLPYLR